MRGEDSLTGEEKGDPTGDAGPAEARRLSGRRCEEGPAADGVARVKGVVSSHSSSASMAATTAAVASSSSQTEDDFFRDLVELVDTFLLLLTAPVLALELRFEIE